MQTREIFFWMNTCAKSRFSLCLLSKYLLCSKNRRRRKKNSPLHWQTYTFLLVKKIRFSRRANIFFVFFPEAGENAEYALELAMKYLKKKIYTNVITSHTAIRSCFAIFVIIAKYSRHPQLIDYNHFFFHNLLS